MELVRTKKEVDDVIRKADDTKGTNFRALTFEEGVSLALRWAIGETDEKPLEDE